MTNRAIELAKSMGLIDDNRRSAYEEWVDLSEDIQAFYEAAKRDGMIEMRERAASVICEPDISDDFADAICALEVKP